jgi:hypothetical protein
VEGDKLLLDMPPVDREYVYNSREAIKLLIEDKVIKNYSCDKLFKAELFQDIRFPVGRNYEDIAIMYKLFDKAKSICHLQEFGYYYVKRENSISNNNSLTKWLNNCRYMAISMYERYDYFSKNRDSELEELSLAPMLTYIITYLILGYKLKCYDDFYYYKKLLRILKKEISRNHYISPKDKNISKFLTYSNWICSLGVHLVELKKVLASVAGEAAHAEKGLEYSD